MVTIYENRIKRGGGKMSEKRIMQRSRWELILDILGVISDEGRRAKKTRILKKAYLDWWSFEKYFAKLLERGFIEEIEDPKAFLKGKVKELIKVILKRSLGSKSLNKLMYYIMRDFIDYGKLDPVIRDTMTEDISVDGPDIPMYIYHRHHGSIRSNVVFNQQELDALVYKLAQRAGRHISLSKPLLSASLPNKDRIELSIGREVTTKGSTLTIRRFKDVPITPVGLAH